MPCDTVTLSRWSQVHRDRDQNGSGRGFGNGREVVFKGYRVSVLVDEKFWGWLVGMVAHTVNT